MMLKESDLRRISGGAFTAAFGNFLLRAYSYVTDLGRYLGSSVSYFIRGVRCR